MKEAMSYSNPFMIIFVKHDILEIFENYIK